MKRHQAPQERLEVLEGRVATLEAREVPLANRIAELEAQAAELQHFIRDARRDYGDNWPHDLSVRAAVLLREE